MGYCSSALQKRAAFTRLCAVSLPLIGFSPVPAAGLQRDTVRRDTIQLAVAEFKKSGDAFPKLDALGPNLLLTHVPLINRYRGGDLEISVHSDCRPTRGTSGASQPGTDSRTASECEPHYWIVVQYLQTRGAVHLFSRLQEEGGKAEYPIAPQHSDTTEWDEVLEKLACAIVNELHRLKTHGRVSCEVRIELGTFAADTRTPPALRGFAQNIPTELKKRLEPRLRQARFDLRISMPAPVVGTPEASARYDGKLSGSFSIREAEITIRYLLTSVHKQRVVLSGSVNGAHGDFSALLDALASEISDKWTPDVDDDLSGRRE